MRLTSDSAFYQYKFHDIRGCTFQKPTNNWQGSTSNITEGWITYSYILPNLKLSGYIWRYCWVLCNYKFHDITGCTSRKPTKNWQGRRTQEGKFAKSHSSEFQLRVTQNSSNHKSEVNLGGTKKLGAPITQNEGKKLQEEIICVPCWLVQLDCSWKSRRRHCEWQQRRKGKLMVPRWLPAMMMPS